MTAHNLFLFPFMYLVSSGGAIDAVLIARRALMATDGARAACCRSLMTEKLIFNFVFKSQAGFIPEVSHNENLKRKKRSQRKAYFIFFRSTNSKHENDGKEK